jgi:hypothetical protein
MTYLTNWCTNKQLYWRIYHSNDVSRKTFMSMSHVIIVQPRLVRTTDLSNKFAQALRVWANETRLYIGNCLQFVEKKITKLNYPDYEWFSFGIINRCNHKYCYKTTRCPVILNIPYIFTFRKQLSFEFTLFFFIMEKYSFCPY